MSVRSYYFQNYWRGQPSPRKATRIIDPQEPQIMSGGTILQTWQASFLWLIGGSGTPAYSTTMFHWGRAYTDLILRNCFYALAFEMWLLDGMRWVLTRYQVWNEAHRNMTHVFCLFVLFQISGVWYVDVWIFVERRLRMGRWPTVQTNVHAMMLKLSSSDNMLIFLLNSARTLR